MKRKNSFKKTGDGGGLKRHRPANFKNKKSGNRKGLDRSKKVSNKKEFHPKEDENGKSRLVIRDVDKEEREDKIFSDSDEDNLEEIGDEEEEMTSHKQTLERLKDKDPEFYQFLQSNDKELLDFDDDEEDFENAEDGQAEQDGDQEDELEEKVEEKITSNRVNAWRKTLQNPESSKAELLSAIKSLIKAFRQTVGQTLDASGHENVEMLNPAIFNLIINSVLVNLLPALVRYLRLQTLKAGKEMIANDDNEDEESCKLSQNAFLDPRRSRNWKNIQAALKAHLTDLLKMMTVLSAEARASFAGHILEMTPFYNVFPHLVKRLIKRFIDEWCTSSESHNRVLASLILHRMIRVVQQNNHLTSSERQMLVNQILRRLYLAYVGTAKVTTRESMAQISFMKNSLVELYQLDLQLAYQHAFIFVRQLAIQLRNSFILKQKAMVKTVYNWQFVHSILLWTQLICTTHAKTDTLDPLVSPLVMVTVGTIRLLQSSRFLPLRFTLIRALIKLSDETETFIPILSHFLEIYQHFNPNKVVATIKNDKKKIKEQKGDGKEEESKKDGHNLKLKQSNGNNKKRKLNLDLLLKVSKEETSQPEFVQLVIDKFYDLALAYLASQSANVSFPEMVAIFLHQSRKFVKAIRTAKERNKIKQLLDKTNENADWVFNQRKKFYLKVNDHNLILVWEREQKHLVATPLLKFYKKLEEFKAKNKTQDEDDYEEDLDEKEASKQPNKREFRVESDVVNGGAKALEGDEDEMLEFEDEDEDDDEGGELGEMEQDDEPEQVEAEAVEDSKQKTKKNKRRRTGKKARKLNSELQLDNAFELSSDDDDDES